MGVNTLEHQPTKIMAMEGHFRSHLDGAPLILLGFLTTKRNKWTSAVELPKIGSLILKHDLNAALPGLDTVAPEDRPPVEMVFWSVPRDGRPGPAHAAAGYVQSRPGAPRQAVRLCARALCVVHGSLRFVAVIAGWITTEVRAAAVHDLRTDAHRGVGVATSTRPRSRHR